MSNTYVPGSWPVLVGPDLTLFTDAAPDTTWVTGCWRLVEAGASLDDLLGAIVHEGLRGVGAFALWSSDRLLVRGSVTVELVDMAGVRSPVASVATPTWHERTITVDTASLALLTTGRAADGPVLPLRCGMALASAVYITRKAEPTAAPAAPPKSARAARSTDVPTASVPHVLEPRAPQPSHTAEPGEVSRHYDELFAMSRTPGTPQASPVQGPPSVAAATTRFENIAPSSHLSAAPPTAAPSHTPSPSTGVIEHLPWAPAGRGTPWIAAPEPEKQPDLSATIQRPRRAASGGTTVSAVRCPAGHLNPVGADSCRVCGGAVVGQEPFETTRPRLGMLVLSTDPEPIPLDRGVVFGRAPTGQGDVDRIALHQPDISANHVEVRLSGWQVLVVDLGSTNGTLMTTPDGHSSALTPRVPVELHHGTEVVLSEEIRFRFEATS